MNASRGIIYSATGPQYVAEAIASAKSSLRFNPLPHVVFCDHEPQQAFDGIEFIRFEPCGDPYLDKIHNIVRTPFAQTIFIDTDTHVLGDLGDLFDLLKRFDIAATHTGYTGCADPAIPGAFYEFNTGVLPYRMSAAVAAFLERWANLRDHWCKSPPSFQLYGEDQPAFRRALWESSLSFYVFGAEYNFRILYAGRLLGKARILHGRSSDYAKLAARVNAVIRPRLIQPLGELPSIAQLEERLAHAERVFGPGHQATATLLNSLAVQHQTEGNLQIAKPLYERALAISQKNLGMEHPDTATSFDNLGGLYQAIGDHVRARLFHERALAIREKVLGRGHPDTARSERLIAGLSTRLS